MSQMAILLGLILGLTLGVLASVTGSPALLRAAEAVAPFGDAFMRAIQMVVIPLVAVTVFVGVAKIGNLRKLGRLGGLSVGFFWLTTLPAILIGMGVMHLALAFTPSVTPPTTTATELAPPTSWLSSRMLVSFINSNRVARATEVFKSSSRPV